jgi:anti-sigma factor RsiW
MMKVEMIEKWALHAYADGQLGPDEAREVEQLLQHNEEARKLVADIRQQRAALQQAFHPVLTETIPPALLRSARRPDVAPARWPKWAMAAGLAALIVGSASGWLAGILTGGSAMAEALPGRALDAYAVYAPEAKHAVEVSAADKDQLEAWFTERIGVKIAVPDLSAKGYSLLGGRLLTEGAKPAGLLIYENTTKKRLVVYVAANDLHTNAPMKVEKRGALVSCFWVEPDLVYALAGEQPASEMLPLADAAHEGFDKNG